MPLSPGSLSTSSTLDSVWAVVSASPWIDFCVRYWRSANASRMRR